MDDDSNSKQCPYCAETIKAAAVKCRYCGSDLSSDSEFECTGCGADVAADADLCPKCGADFRDTETAGANRGSANQGEPQSAETKTSCLRSTKPVSDRVIVGIAVAFFAVPALICWAISSSSPLPTDQPSEKQPVEQQLATINLGSPADASDPAIEEFRTVLDSIEAKTPNARQEIADQTVATYQELQKMGRSEGLLEVMQALDGAIPEEWAGQPEKQQKYAEVCATFLVLAGPGR